MDATTEIEKRLATIQGADLAIGDRTRLMVSASFAEMAVKLAESGLSPVEWLDLEMKKAGIPANPHQ
jgi:hypothetical protein